MEEPEAGDFLPRKLLGAAAPTVSHRVTLRVEDLDQPPKKLHQPIARTALHARRHVIRIIHEVTGTVSFHASDGQRHDVLEWLDVECETKILASDAHRLLVTAGGIVKHRGCLGVIAGGRPVSLAVQAEVRAIGAIGRNGEKDEMRVLRGREKLPDIQLLGRGVASGNVEGQSVGEHSPGVNDRDGIIANGFGLELTSDQAIRREEKTRDRELNRVLEVAALRLEVMLRQVHALVPDHAGKLLHLVPSFGLYYLPPADVRRPECIGTILGPLPLYGNQMGACRFVISPDGHRWLASAAGR